jgi:UPF0176 protein
MQKVILYYLFTPITDPEAIRLWQASLCESLNLRGRIIISEHGINGTLGGNLDDLKRYVTKNKGYTPFKKLTYKWSEGSREDFPRLSVKVRDEIVTFNAKNELKVDEKGVVGGGKHLKPEQLHKLIEKKQVVFLDGRNQYEAEVGRFKDAVIPKVNNTRDFVKELEKPEYNELKNKPIVTYCTGGIRCEVLSSLMINRGFKEVYQIEGGIAKYLEKYGDKGLWEGSLYVFDKRMGLKPSEDTPDIGHCIYCNGNTSRFINCANKQCNQLILVCDKCDQETYCKNCVKQTSKILLKTT